MFVSVVKRREQAEIHPDVLGARVLITGLSHRNGVDVARAFAEHKARLVIQSADTAPEFTALVPLLADDAQDMQLYNDAIDSGDAAVRLAQTAAKVLGGLDVVINLVSVTREDLANRRSLEEIEDLASEKLLAPTLITRVVGNRMRVTWSEGLILNVVHMPAPETAEEAAVAGILRAALTAITQDEAKKLADDAIRVNAVGPRALVRTATDGACLAGDPEIASLALYLASKYGRKLTGQIFDAEAVIA
ncbi:MAG: SDR family oxidoreductase [Alphaproteobacteria bacterium]|nr:SDR family oxidoreductase [Alphaproteobacteria bacterium]